MNLFDVDRPTAVRVIQWTEDWWTSKEMSGYLSVLADGQYVGTVYRGEAVAWIASTVVLRRANRVTEHDDPNQAVRRVLRSGLCRHLGVRASSPVYWSDRANKLLARLRRRKVAA